MSAFSGEPCDVIPTQTKFTTGECRRRATSVDAAAKSSAGSPHSAHDHASPMMPKMRRYFGLGQRRSRRECVVVRTPLVNQLGIPAVGCWSDHSTAAANELWRRFCKALEHVADRGRSMNGFEIIQVITLMVAAMLLSVVFGVSWVTQRIERHDVEQRRQRRRGSDRDR
jgi:hypothetical protein